MIKALIGLLVVMIFALSGGPAFSVTIGFDGITVNGQFTGPLTEDGYTYAQFGSSGGLFGDKNYGNPAPEMEALAALGGGILQVVSAIGGESFLFLGIDIAQRDSRPNVSDSITIEGYLSNIFVASETFTTIPADPTCCVSGPYQTVYPSTGLLLNAPVDELRIHLLGGITNEGLLYLTRIDNIEVGAIPEPSTLLLLGTGLLGVVGIARRRKD